MWIFILRVYGRLQVSRVECGIQRLSLQRLMGPAAAQPCPADNTPLPADPVTAALISAATPRPGPSAWGSPASEATWQFTPEGHRVSPIGLVYRSVLPC